MDIITGYTGTKHVTAENDRDINIGIFGSGSYVLSTGAGLKAEISSNNEIKIRDGVVMHQGCAAAIKKNTYDSITIVNGSQGMKRIDLIVARYEKQRDTNVESLTLKALQGKAVESSPTAPAHTAGDIQEGDAIADMPLYEVVIDGLNITEVRKKFQTVEDLVSLKSKCYKNISDGVEESVYQIGNEIHVIGTMVKQSGGDYIALFTEAQLRKWFGTDYDVSRLNITTNNGDSATAATHLYAPEKWSDGAWYQYFYPRYVGPIRINYQIVYKIKG